MKPYVTAIIPALNEEAAIGGVVSTIGRSTVDEVIVVDNGSTDATAERAAAAGARVVHEPQHGYGRACAAGVRALSAACDIVVFLDGDGSDAAEEVEKLIDPVASRSYDFAIGSRTRGMREPGSMAAHQVFAGWLAGTLIAGLYGVSYTDMSPFRAVSRDLLDRLPMTELTYGWNLQMQILVACAGARVLEVPVTHRRRSGGTSKVSGSLSGTLRASTRILWLLARVAFARRARSAASPARAYLRSGGYHE